MVEWRHVPLKELSERVSVGHVGPTGEFFCLPGQGVRLIRSQNIRPGRLHVEDCAWVTRDFDEAHKKSRVIGGDILITRVGANAGDVCRVPDECGELQLSSAVFSRPKPGFSRWIEYYLRSPIGQQSLLTTIVGSVSERINTRDAEKILIPVPAEIERRAITEILGALDDKIEVNRRMNETLEAMAQAIFRDWFVDFGPTRAKMEGREPYLAPDLWALFPDTLDDEGKPAGWHTVPLGEIVSITKGRSYKRAELQESSAALVTLKSFQRGGGYRRDGLKSYTGQYKPEQVVQPGEVVIALTDVTQAADVIGKPAIVLEDTRYQTLVASLDVGIVRSKVDYVGRSFLVQVLLSDQFQKHAYSHTTGTTVLHLGKDAVPTFLACLPVQKITAQFEAIAEPLYRRIAANARENDFLAATRDLLLPKLMSGEIRVRDAAAELEAAQ